MLEFQLRTTKLSIQKEEFFYENISMVCVCYPDRFPLINNNYYGI